MEGKKYQIKKIITIIIYVYYIAGILWHLLPATRSIVIDITPYGLLFFPVLILYFGRDSIDSATFIWLFLILVLTLLLEVIGVKTGIIFGNYFYKNLLGIKIFGVPLIIGINWMMVVYGLFSFTQSFFKVNKIAQSLVVGFFAVLFDFALEPVAVELNYWEWNSASVPLSNYISWFTISFFFAIAGFTLKAMKGSTLVIHYFFAQFLFFAILNFLMSS
ncbi:MAG: carotenoid biosynthesis protein [Ignavibacteria bacterium]